MTERTLPLSEIKAFYNSHGLKQDRAKFEEGAFEAILPRMELESADALFEFGCGTGRIALRMLESYLPSYATYHGVDVSETMIEIAEGRIEPFGERAQVQLSAGGVEIPASDAQFDRFFSTFVLDLLPEAEIGRLLDEAWRVLKPNGLLAIAGLTHGNTPLAKVVGRVWMVAFHVRPRWVGGCRPLVMAKYVESAEKWQPHHHEIVTRGGLSSEVLVVRKL